MISYKSTYLKFNDKKLNSSYEYINSKINKYNDKYGRINKTKYDTIYLIEDCELKSDLLAKHIIGLNKIIIGNNKTLIINCDSTLSINELIIGENSMLINHGNIIINDRLVNNGIFKNYNSYIDCSINNKSYNLNSICNLTNHSCMIFNYYQDKNHSSIFYNRGRFYNEGIITNNGIFYNYFGGKFINSNSCIAYIKNGIVYNNFIFYKSAFSSFKDFGNWFGDSYDIIFN